MSNREVNLSIRVGIDGRYLQDHFPGIGRYTFNLIKWLATLEGGETYTVFYSPSSANSRFDLRTLEGPRVTFRKIDIPPLSIRSQAALPAALRKAKVDVFHSPHYPLPIFASLSLLSTIHDTIPLSDPAYMPSPGSREAYRLALFLAVLRSKGVIVDSTASREDLVRHLRVIPYRVKTVYLGVDTPETRDGYTPSERFILYVGTNRPHKNLPGLVQAYAKARPALPLVIAGAMDCRYPEAQRQAEALGLTGRVHFLGHVREDRLEQLYRSASLFVFPSLAEGFGLPALEAMAYGVPVVTSDRPAINEVVGEAAIRVDPLDTEALAGAIVRVLDDPELAHHLSRAGIDRATLFPWSRTAEGCLRLYREVAKA